MRHIILFIANILLLAVVCWAYVTLGLGDVESEAAEVIVWQLRFPRMIAAMGVGALLSLAGALLQGVFRNPLVEPYTMGLSGGAVAGVAVAFVSGAVAAFGGVAISVAAALGGLASLAIVLVMRRAVGYDTTVMLMCGIMVSFVASAATSVMVAFASRHDVAQVFAWSIGSFEAVNPSLAVVVAVVALVAVVASPLAGNLLNVLSLGDVEARSLGVSPSRVSALFFVAATLLTALSVAAAGVVAFVGMAVPHMVRGLYGIDGRVLLPASGLLGALVMVVCDFLAKSLVSPLELPAGAICALLGGIMFTYLTVRWKKVMR